MDSYQIFTKANNLVQQCETRRPECIAQDLGIWVYEEPAFTNLLGMYTFRWNHRLIFLNPHLEYYVKRIVLAHEIGHDQEHREKAKASRNGLQEFSLFNMKDTTEYEANVFAAHLLLDNDDVYHLAKQGADVVQIAKILNILPDLLIIKIQEMNRLGYDINIPYLHDEHFFRQIKKN